MVSSGMIDLKFYLTYLGVETLLCNSPDGWDEESVKWERDTKYWGMFRKFTIPLQFVKDGAKLIRTAFYTYGINADVTIRVDKRNMLTNQFETKYTGILNFTTFHDSWEYVEINCEQGGLSAAIQRNEATVYDIAFPTVGDQTIARYTGQISNYETFTWVSPEQFYDDEVTDPPANPTDADREVTVKFDESDFKNLNGGTLHIANYKNDPAYTWGIVIDRDCELKLSVTPNGRTFELFLNAGSPTGYTFEYREQILLERGGVTTILQEIASLDVAVTQQTTWETFYPSSSGEATYPTSGNYQFLAGDKITITAKVHYTVGPVNYYFRFNNNCAYILKTQIFDRLVGIDILAWKPVDLLTAIVNKLGSGFAVKSDYLAARDTLILPAESCRSELNTAAITHTSLESFFKTFFITEGLGMGVEIIAGIETLVVEPLAYFIGSTTAHDVGNVKNFEIDVADDLMNSEIEIGFERTFFEDYFGRTEIHGSSTWDISINGVTSPQKWLSPYRGDLIGIDQMRIKQLQINMNTTEAVDTKDTDGDLDNFILDCKFSHSTIGADYYIPNRDYTITGVAFPLSVGNVRFTPRRCMLRHSDFLASIMFLSTGGISPLSGTRVYNYFTFYPGETGYMQEKSTILAAEMDSSIFIPLYLKFAAPAKFSLIDNVDSEQYGTIKFTYRGAEYYGVVMEVSANLAHDQQSTYKLLCATKNDITNLIH